MKALFINGFKQPKLEFLTESTIENKKNEFFADLTENFLSNSAVDCVFLVCPFRNLTITAEDYHSVQQFISSLAHLNVSADNTYICHFHNNCNDMAVFQKIQVLPVVFETAQMTKHKKNIEQWIQKFGFVPIIASAHLISSIKKERSTAITIQLSGKPNPIYDCEYPGEELFSYTIVDTNKTPINILKRIFKEKPQIPDFLLNATSVQIGAAIEEKLMTSNWDPDFAKRVRSAFEEQDVEKIFGD